jgi:hypothetical protein
LLLYEFGPIKALRTVTPATKSLEWN